MDNMMTEKPKCRCGLVMSWSEKNKNWYCAEKWLSEYTGADTSGHEEAK